MGQVGLAGGPCLRQGPAKLAFVATQAYGRSIARVLVIRWVSNVAALFVAAWALSGVTYGDRWWTLFVAAAVVTLVNAWVKPLLTILSIPFIVVTLGFFYFLLNVLMLYVTDWLVPAFEIETFWWGALAAAIVSVVNAILQPLLPDPWERDEPAGRGAGQR
jgi:putative membrane protein